MINEQSLIFDEDSKGLTDYLKFLECFVNK